MNEPKPTLQHEWLQQLVGEWTFEMDHPAEAGKPPEKLRAVERVRSLDGLWTVAEMEGQMPGGGTARSVMTLGYDPRKERFVGTFVSSAMMELWVYEGRLEADGKTLVLASEGPDMSGRGTANYRDTIRIESPDHRTMASSLQKPDGTWEQFMLAHYRRTR